MSPQIGYSITVLLSVMLQMGLVSDFLPVSSEVVPLATQYLAAITVISVVSVIVTVLIIFLHHKKEERGKQRKKITNALEKIKSSVLKTKTSSVLPDRSFDRVKDNVVPLSMWKRSSVTAVANSREENVVELGSAKRETVERFPQGLNDVSREQTPGDMVNKSQSDPGLCTGRQWREDQDVKKNSAFFRSESIKCNTTYLQHVSDNIDRVSFFIFVSTWSLVTLFYMVALFG